MNNTKMHIFLHNNIDKKIIEQIKDELLMFKQFSVFNDNKNHYSIEQRNIDVVLEPILITNSNYLSILSENDYIKHKDEIYKFYQVSELKMKDKIDEIMEQIFYEFFIVSNIDEEKIKETMKNIYNWREKLL